MGAVQLENGDEDSNIGDDKTRTVKERFVQQLMIDAFLVFVHVPN